ncbi:MAG: hypothetical protein IPQ11_18015 [Bacteroidetes bacterium]|nr:hypothetical protein [Bacteroidota bacterium]
MCLAGTIQDISNLSALHDGSSINVEALTQQLQLIKTEAAELKGADHLQKLIDDAADLLQSK